jgi:L-cysteine:1D-myo-inositol 2-amino-2-deoxy-alpha-D-glucopyranoside ligase
LVAQGIDPVAIRLTILRHHYRSAWTWSQQLLNESIAELDLWRTALAMQGGADAALLLGVIRSSLAQDLDTPAALSAVNNWAESTINGNQSDPSAQGLVARALDALLGIAL